MYEVSEDSYLLRNTLRDEPLQSGTAIEVGVGSGVITVVLAEQLDTVIGVDIDGEAVSYCKDKFSDNPSVTIKHSDMFDAVGDVEASVITANPPYLPSTAGDNSDDALDGGETGIEYTVRFLDAAASYLADDGRIYFVASDKADLNGLHDFLDASQYEWRRLRDTRYFFETLYVYRAQALD